MPRPASDREAIEAEIANVRSLGLDELHTLWRLTFRSAPPAAFTKDLMARFLCWDIQEQAFGGLDPEILFANEPCSSTASISLMLAAAEGCPPLFTSNNC
jgi:hypothetical protein